MGDPLAGMGIAPDGTKKRVLRYETLGKMSRRQAADLLRDKLAATSASKAPSRSRVPFRTIATEWDTSVLPMYKHSTQKHRRFMLKKHLLPRFGDHAISDITRQEIQMYVAQLIKEGYAPKSIDHIHDVLSAVLRTAVKWGHLFSGEPGEWRRPPEAQDGPSEVGAYARPGSGTA